MKTQIKKWITRNFLCPHPSFQYLYTYETYYGTETYYKCNKCSKKQSKGLVK